MCSPSLADSTKQLIGEIWGANTSKTLSKYNEIILFSRILEADDNEGNAGFPTGSFLMQRNQDRFGMNSIKWGKLCDWDFVVSEVGRRTPTF